MNIYPLKLFPPFHHIDHLHFHHAAGGKKAQPMRRGILIHAGSVLHQRCNFPDSEWPTSCIRIHFLIIELYSFFKAYNNWSGNTFFPNQQFARKKILKLNLIIPYISINVINNQSFTDSPRHATTYAGFWSFTFFIQFHGNLPGDIASGQFSDRKIFVRPVMAQVWSLLSVINIDRLFVCLFVT